MVVLGHEAGDGEGAGGGRRGKMGVVQPAAGRDALQPGAEVGCTWSLEKVVEHRGGRS